MSLQRESISVTEEKRIALGLIVSTKFAQGIQNIYNEDYFTNTYLRIISGWCMEYYLEFDKAPYTHIKDIFNDHSQNLDDTSVELIGKLLIELDNSYTIDVKGLSEVDRNDRIEQLINYKYYMELTLDYFQNRELDILVNNVAVLKEKGDSELAAEEIKNFKLLSIGDIKSENAYVKLHDMDVVSELFRKRDEEEVNFFHMPGALGKYLGNHKRGDVVGYFAPAKRGKTMVLVNSLVQAIISKKKTLFFSIEMIDTEVMTRVFRALHPMVDDPEEDHYFPVFDCLHNQNGDCVDRESEVVVIDNDDFMDDPKHKPCDKCRFDPNKKIQSKYKCVVYQQAIKRPKDDFYEVEKFFKKRFQKMFKKYCRVVCHPKYTLTYDQMRADMDYQWKKYAWNADIIILDYIDILAIDSKFDDYRLEDERWKLLAKIAGETNTLMITVTQANKAGHTTGTLDSTHQGGFYGKNRHVNLMCGLNQTAEEKVQGIMEFGITEARSHPFIQGRTCTVLQSFSAGQAHLDSYYNPFQVIKQN